MKVSRQIKRQFDILRERVREHEGQWRSIASQSEVSYRWLVEFAAGRVQNPRLSYVQRLAEVMGMSFTFRISSEAPKQPDSRPAA